MYFRISLLLLLQSHVGQCSLLVAGFAVINVAIGLISGTWSLVECIKMYVVDNEVNLSLLNLQIQSIKVEEHLSHLRNEVPRLRENIAFDRQMEKLALAIKKVEIMFHDYVTYSANFSKTVKRNDYPNSTYEDYEHRVFRGNLYGVAELLDEIAEIVAPNVETDVPLIDTLVANREEFGKICKTKLSKLQSMKHLLGYITTIELKGLLLILFGYDIKEWLHADDFTKNRNLEQRKSIDRHNRIVRKFKLLFGLMSNELYVCDPKSHVNQNTYFELKSLFQTYLMQEIDVKSLFNCTGTCENIELTIPRCIYKSKTSPSLCEETFGCNTKLKECKPFYATNNVPLRDVVPRVCISQRPFGWNRYNFVAFNSTDQRKCSGVKFMEAKDLHITINRLRKNCIYCQCTCANGNKQKVNYEFSLLPNIADYEENHVVIGVRFAKKRDVIYIQLQQGKLLPNGVIDPRTIVWKGLPNRDLRTRTIDWNSRIVDLNSLKVPENQVVVGINMAITKEGMMDHFGLQLSYLPFNFTSGVVDKYAELRTVTFNPERQSELKFYQKDTPTGALENVLDSQDGQFLTFQASGLEEDGGHSTIPFIDMQNVTSRTPSPLSGVGLIHRGNWKTGGFLSLNIFTYNFTSHIREDDVSGEDFIQSLVKNRSSKSACLKNV